MATLHTLRILLIVPAARVAAVVTWFQANIGATSVPADLGPALNPSGLTADPVTHRWCSGAWTDAQAKAILAKLCDLAGVTKPTNAQWTGWTRQQKVSWLLSVQAGLFSGYGVWVQLMFNDEGWDASDGALEAVGVQVRGDGRFA
jgi:hypothetical protein